MLQSHHHSYPLYLLKENFISKSYDSDFANLISSGSEL